MQYFNNNLAIEANWLIVNEVVSKSNYDKLAKRGHLNVVRRGCLNTPALVDYESMPERFKRKIVLLCGGSPYDLVKTNQLEARIQASAEAAHYFDSYKLADGRFLPPETRREYYANAIVLEAITRMITDKKAKRSALGHKTSGYWEVIADAVMQLDRKKYPHTLPGNGRRLKERWSRYRAEGYESLIHRNFLNTNAAKVDDEVKESLLMELLADPRNLDNAQVVRMYNLIAERLMWKRITTRTVAVWRDKMELVTYAGRRGSVAFSNRKGMQVKRSAPSCPLYYLTLDGWEAELLYQRTETNKKTGYSVTTYHHRPVVVVILDACCKYPLGFAVGTHETPELIKEALRDAARHTRELFTSPSALSQGEGTMYRAHQIQSDHYAMKKLAPFYEVLGDKYTPARAKNAKAKIIEPYFNYLNKTYCQMQPNWSGFGITSNKDKQPNVEYLNKYKKDFPDFDGVCAQVAQMMWREREAKREDYLKAWANTPEADKIPLTYENYLFHFGEKTQHRILLQGSGLHPTINGIRRAYDCFDITFREHAGVRWEVRYDPQDLSHILAVSEDETLRYVLEEKYVQPMALKERKPGDSDELQRVRNYNKALDESITERRARSAENVDGIREMLNEVNMLHRLMITDSRGQHKDNLTPRPYLTPIPSPGGDGRKRRGDKTQHAGILPEPEEITDNDEFDTFKLY